jgi:hypothetical protein
VSRSISTSERTLTDWRERYPELGPRMEAARETARQKALEGIKTAGEKDWRALAEWLKLTFSEHRQASSINVTATASAQQAGRSLHRRTTPAAHRNARAATP